MMMTKMSTKVMMMVGIEVMSISLEGHCHKRRHNKLCFFTTKVCVKRKSKLKIETKFKSTFEIISWVSLDERAERIKIERRLVESAGHGLLVPNYLVARKVCNLHHHRYHSESII